MSKFVFCSIIVVIILLSSEIFSATLTEDFSSMNYFDSSSTGDWNAALGLARAGLDVDTTAGDQVMDIGNGANGTCNYTTNTTIASGTYNCTTLTIGGGVTVSVSGTSSLVFKVLGDVTITGELNVTGPNGTPDAVVAGPLAGGVGVAGGYNGGSSTDQLLAGNNGADGGTGAGVSGTAGDDGGVSGRGGCGGGGGAGHAGASATAGANGLFAFGGVAGTLGAAGADYGDQQNFTTAAILGGAGGASGSASDRGGTQKPGGGGGAGGGVIHIAAGNDITVTGNIFANGGDGGGDGDYGGCGGAGAGGVIFLQSAGAIDLTGGAVNATGGTGGASPSGGNGGDGGDGRIRVEDANGAIGGAVALDPAAQFPSGVGAYMDVDFITTATIVQSTGYDTNGLKNNFKAPTITHNLNGGTITYSFSDSADNLSWDAWVSQASIASLNKRYIRFRASITPGGGTPDEDTPSITQIVINYTTAINLNSDFESDISCGSISLGDDGGSGLNKNIFTFILGFFLIYLLLAPLGKKSIPTNN